jgi:hypothetical protein
MRRPWSTGGCCAKKNQNIILHGTLLLFVCDKIFSNILDYHICKRISELDRFSGTQSDIGIREFFVWNVIIMEGLADCGSRTSGPTGNYISIGFSYVK